MTDETTEGTDAKPTLRAGRTAIGAAVTSPAARPPIRAGR